MWSLTLLDWRENVARSGPTLGKIEDRAKVDCEVPAPSTVSVV